MKTVFNLPYPMMYKEAAVEDLYNKFGKPALMIAGALGIPYLVEKAVDYGVNILKDSTISMIQKDKLDGKRPLSDIIEESKKIAGLPNIPHVTIDNYENAAYIPPGSVERDLEKQLTPIANKLILSEDKRRKAEGEFILKGIEYSKKPHGGIVVGDKFSNPAIVGHELGHAMIREGGGFNNLVQSYSDKLKMIGAPTALAGLVTSLFSPTVGEYLLYGGLGTYGVGSLGKIYSEYKASDYGLDLLAKQKIQKKEYNDALNKGIMTYALSETKVPVSALALQGYGSLMV